MKTGSGCRCAMVACVAVGAVFALGVDPAGQSQAVPESIFQGLMFRTVGPAVFAGRVNDLAVYEANPALYYVGTTTGGLWKTVNNGTTWEVLFNDQDDVVSIGDVTIAQDDPNLVWIGTGGSQSWGNGVYKSVDGGHTWRHMGLADSKHISRILIDPTNRDIVYAAAMGHLWGPNAERGVFKTTDGGATWTKVLFVDEDTGAGDLVMHPSSPHVLYAATHQRRRAPWGTNGAGPGGAIYRSTDAGKTWTKLTKGLPEGPYGRISLDIYRKNPDVLYAMIESPKGKDVYRSDDAGASWRKMNDPAPDPRYLGHSMRVFDHILVDPTDDHRVYLLGVNVYMSDDSGRTFAINESAVQSGLWPPTNGLFIFNTSTHSDHRAMWINPKNSDHLVSGSDGGICTSYDRGRTWDFLDNMDLGQFYHVGFDMDTPYRVYGGLQDNLGWGGPSAVRSYLGIGAGEWFLVAGGDGFVAVADPKDPRTVYAESQNGNMSRVDRLTNERQAIRPEPAQGEERLRWNFNTPMFVSPHSSTTLYMAANRVFKSTDRGMSWAAISPDLTAKIDPTSLSLMGVKGKAFKIGSASSTYGSIVTLAESPKRAGLLYTGADDGTVQVSKDGGQTWTDLSARFPGLPKQTSAAVVKPSAFDDGTVYATFSGFANDDYAPYVFASTDFGQTWRSIAGTVPKGHVVRSIAEDQRNPDVLYLGTEFGLFATLDKGAHWTRVRGNLPTMPIYEIVMHPRENDLILATFSRGIWILDDARPFQQAADALRTDAYLFDIRPTLQFSPAHDRWWMWGDRRFWGQNPAYGAAISYYVKDPPKRVAITIRDASGAVVREMSDEDLKDGRTTGINRIQWNLRHQPLPLPSSQRVPEGVQPFFSGYQAKAHSYQEVKREELNPLNGPFVLPGAYRVTLAVDGREVGTKSVTVSGDPLIQISAADRKTLHDVLVSVHALQRVAYDGAEAVAAVNGHFALVQDTMKNMKSPPAPAPAAKAVEEFSKRLTDLQSRLRLPVPGALGGDTGGRPANLSGQVASLKLQLMGVTALPTQWQARRVRDLDQEVDKAIAELNDVITTGLPGLYKVLAEHNVRPTPPAQVNPIAKRSP